jgi:hypothetical protein
MTMRLLIALLAVVLVGCDSQAPTPTFPDIDIDINITNNNNGGGGQPGPGTSVCNPVARVDARIGSPSLRVGQTTRLDATPFDTAGNPRSDACNLASGIAWAQTGPCSLSSATVFNPVVTTTAPGICNFVALVEGTPSNTATLTVVP